MIKVIDGIKYDLYELPKHYNPVPKKAIVLGMADDCYVSMLAVKSYIDGHRVEEIAKDAFNGNDILHSIVLPKTIQSIGICAFERCTQLKSVEIQGKSTIKIGHLAFNGCSNLEVVESKRAMWFDDKASGIFRDCPLLKSIPPLYDKIPWHICYGSHNVKELTVVNQCLISSVLFPQAFEWAVFDDSDIRKLIVSEFATKAPNAYWIDYNEVANVLNQSRISIQTTANSPAVNLAFEGVEVIIVDNHLT